MQYAMNSKQMKMVDDYTIDVAGITALELMERAAAGLVAIMKTRITKSDRILAICGPGNNGGDGVAASRLLHLEGYQVAVLLLGDNEKRSLSMKRQLEMAENIGIMFEHRDRITEYNILIDALFGVGLTREITGEYAAIIDRMKINQSYIYAVDIPSGISADTGKVLAHAVEANETVTFGYQKLGMLLYPGVDYAGKVTLIDIGFSTQSEQLLKHKISYYKPEDLVRLPKRCNYSNKGSYGKVLIIAGSKGMSGAAYLSAKAAYRSGAGLVMILTSHTNRIILQTLLPEALFAAYDNEMDNTIAINNIQDALLWASVIVIGPGIGRTELSNELMELVIKEAKAPLILDADALQLLSNKISIAQSQQLNDQRSEQSPQAKEKDMAGGQDNSTFSSKQHVWLNALNRMEYLNKLLPENTILTPHLKELSSLLGLPISYISNNLIDTARQCSYNSKLIFNIKDARSIVTDGLDMYINVTGNNGMATGGTGDVLTGIIAAFLAQGMQAYEAVCLASYIHGLAGDVAALEKGVYSLIASDVVDAIEKVICRKG